MGKVLLSEPDYSGDFQVVAISSQLPDYKQCYHINSCLGIKLTKKDDFRVYTEGIKIPETYSIYIDLLDDKTTYYFLRKNNQADFLAPVSFLLVTIPLPDDLFREMLVKVTGIEGVFDAGEVPLSERIAKPALMKNRQEIFNILAEMELYLMEQNMKEDKASGKYKWKKPRKRKQ